ncbi:CinA family protein [Fretibacter rubidus]|uniref:CinA family protein n=1 Tax=Fretibacter rubidus TaxID=570162 RepID=UPI00352A1E73
MKNPTLADIFKLAAEVLDKAKAQELKLATAESCTGGLIGAAITSIPGSSSNFRGGIIAYDNLVKTNVLSVPHGMIQKYGAVSKFVAGSMAKNVLDVVKADMAVSVTGVAGPSGGSKEKPVGTVWIGLAFRDDNAPNGVNVTSRLMNFKGMDRNKVRDATCYEALYTIKKALDAKASVPATTPSDTQD